MELTLDQIAGKLEALEDTIIYELIERAQFKLNPGIYMKGESGLSGNPNRSLFEIMFRMQEYIHALFGRFTTPEERPFNKNLPEARRSMIRPDSGLHIDDHDKVNLTREILPTYLQLVSLICEQGADGEYGSSVVADIAAVQAIAERVHYGAFYVAERKFLDEEKTYRKLIAASDIDGIMAQLTRPEVEAKILDRVKSKVAHVQEGANTKVRRLIAPDVVAQFYEDHIIPLTKEGEVLYLLNRNL